MFDTPVLFLVFNRPDTTRRVLAAIREAQPKQLFIAADGPRSAVPGEAALCATMRQQLLDGIDWDCRVETLFRDENLGCEAAVASGISWFFSQVEEGIILEDDCLPAADFFGFCQEMLARYKKEPAVAMVSGTSFLGTEPRPEKYFFSKYYAIWGWATWRERWEVLYESGMPQWAERNKSGWLRTVFRQSNIVYFYTAIFDKMARGLVDTWDTNWNYSLLRRDKLTVTPVINLVSNIGLEGTHSALAEGNIFNLPVGSYVSDGAAPAVVAWKEELDALQFVNAGVDILRWRIMARYFLDRWGLLALVLRLQRFFRL